MNYYERQLRSVLFDKRFPKDVIFTMQVRGFLETPGASMPVETKWMSLSIESLNEIISVLQEYRDKL